MRITLLVDDIAPEGRRAAHGFSALVQAPEALLLFDTGPDGELLLDAMEAEGVSVADLDQVVVSHAHRDHVGGLARLLYDRPRLPVSVPVSAAQEISRMLPREAIVIGEKGAREVASHVMTTGELGDDIPEQALILETDKGSVVLVGCGHPGLGTLLVAAGGNVVTVIGGIHDLSDGDVSLTSLEGMVACHCTPSKRVLAGTYDWIELGAVGKVIEMEPPRGLSQ